jgi:hypothetical protein
MVLIGMVIAIASHDRIDQKIRLRRERKCQRIIIRNSKVEQEIKKDATLPGLDRDSSRTKATSGTILTVRENKVNKAGHKARKTLRRSVIVHDRCPMLTAAK